MFKDEPLESERESVLSLTDRGLVMNNLTNSRSERAETYCIIDERSNKFEIHEQSLKEGPGL